MDQGIENVGIVWASWLVGAVDRRVAGIFVIGSGLTYLAAVLATGPVESVDLVGLLLLLYGLALAPVLVFHLRGRSPKLAATSLLLGAGGAALSTLAGVLILISAPDILAGGPNLGLIPAMTGSFLTALWLISLPSVLGGAVPAFVLALAFAAGVARIVAYVPLGSGTWLGSIRYWASPLAYALWSLVLGWFWIRGGSPDDFPATIERQPPSRITSERVGTVIMTMGGTALGVGLLVWLPTSGALGPNTIPGGELGRALALVSFGSTVGGIVAMGFGLLLLGADRLAKWLGAFAPR